MEKTSCVARVTRVCYFNLFRESADSVQLNQGGGKEWEQVGLRAQKQHTEEKF